MHLTDDTQSMLRLIECNVRSAIPWSKKHFNFEDELQQTSNTMQRTKEFEYRVKNIQYNDHLKAMQRQKILNRSLKSNEQRRNTYLSQKKKRMSLHCKKVNQKFDGYKTAQKNEYKRATLHQKKLSQSISQHWKDKNKELQKREKSIYKKYNTQKSEEKLDGSSAQFMMTEVKDDTQFDLPRIRNQKNQINTLDKSIDARNRMKQLDEEQQHHSFQKLMRKLSKIQCKKRQRFSKPLNTEGCQSEKSMRYISTSPVPQRILGTRVIRQQPRHSLSFVHERKKLSSKYRQNMETRKILRDRMYTEHTKYLENYRHRIDVLKNMKHVKEKLIETKLYLQRKKFRSHSNI